MKPRVGLTLLTSSFMIFLTMVVFPALSSPLRNSNLVANYESWKMETHNIKILISLSFNRAFRKIDNILFFTLVSSGRWIADGLQFRTAGSPCVSWRNLSHFHVMMIFHAFAQWQKKIENMLHKFPYLLTTCTSYCKRKGNNINSTFYSSGSQSRNHVGR